VREQEDVSESRPIHATFQEAVQQLAGASKEYQREGVDFLRAVLNADPAKRLTAQQALDHPILTNEFVSVAPDSMPPKIKEPILVDNTLTRAVEKACDKLLGQKNGEDDNDEEDEEDADKRDEDEGDNNGDDKDADNDENEEDGDEEAEKEDDDEEDEDDVYL
jgi:hypothetical protein